MDHQAVSPSHVEERSERVDAYMTSREVKQIEGVIFVTDHGSKSSVVREALVSCLPEIVSGDREVPPVPDYDGESAWAVQTYMEPSNAEKVETQAADSDNSISAFIRAVVDDYLNDKYGERLEMLVGMAD